MTDKDTIAAAVVGELIPQFRYAAPVLLERFDRGEPSSSFRDRDRAYSGPFARLS